MARGLTGAFPRPPSFLVLRAAPEQTVPLVDRRDRHGRVRDRVRRCAGAVEQGHRLRRPVGAARVHPDPAQTAARLPLANGMGEYYKQRYGSSWDLVGQPSCPRRVNAYTAVASRDGASGWCTLWRWSNSQQHHLRTNRLIAARRQHPFRKRHRALRYSPRLRAACRLLHPANSPQPKAVLRLTRRRPFPPTASPLRWRGGNAKAGR